jgi:hypothetical protein
VLALPQQRQVAGVGAAGGCRPVVSALPLVSKIISKDKKRNVQFFRKFVKQNFSTL